jgi:hypothetical protein
MDWGNIPPIPRLKFIRFQHASKERERATLQRQLVDKGKSNRKSNGNGMSNCNGKSNSKSSCNGKSNSKRSSEDKCF